MFGENTFQPPQDLQRQWMNAAQGIASPAAVSGPAQTVDHLSVKIAPLWEISVWKSDSAEAQP